MTDPFDILAAAEAVRAASTGTPVVDAMGRAVCGVCDGSGSVRARPVSMGGSGAWVRVPCPSCRPARVDPPLLGPRGLAH